MPDADQEAPNLEAMGDPERWPEADDPERELLELLDQELEPARNRVEEAIALAKAGCHILQGAEPEGHHYQRVVQMGELLLQTSEMWLDTLEQELLEL